MFELNRKQIKDFCEDGFVIVDSLIDDDRIQAAATRFDNLFKGQFETGVTPDEVNWLEGRDDPALTRQICNGWRADRCIARVVLDQTLGKACAILGGWPGARLLQDNVIWKPPKAKSLGFHQDNAYLDWFEPGELITCWLALDATNEESGTLEFVKGSHRWGEFDMARQFHAPKHYRQEMYEVAKTMGETPNIVYVVVPKGGGSFHHGWIYHGSGPNRGSTPRRVLVMHCCSSEAQYSPHQLARGTGHVYSRYKRLGDNIMDENYFPILWTRDGYRTPALEEYCDSNESRQ